MFFAQYCLQKDNHDLRKRPYNVAPTHLNGWRYFHREIFDPDQINHKPMNMEIRRQPHEANSQTEILDSASAVAHHMKMNLTTPVTSLPLISKNKFFTYSSKKKMKFRSLKDSYRSQKSFANRNVNKRFSAPVGVTRINIKTPFQIKDGKIHFPTLNTIIFNYIKKII